MVAVFYSNNMQIRYYPMINKLIKNFNIRKKIATSPPLTSISFEKPYITIAREPGSGGHPVAHMVAKQLGFQIIDEEIIDEIAKSIDKRKEIVKAVDEKSRTWITNMTHQLLNQEYIDDIEYMRELLKVIVAHALQGKVVILGRGANFITPFEKGLHVNITAPRKVRIDRAIKHEGYTKSKATRIINKIEKERQAFVRQYLYNDPTKVNSYDLTINTTSYSIDQVKDIIIQAYYAKFPKEKKFLDLGRSFKN